MDLLRGVSWVGCDGARCCFNTRPVNLFWTCKVRIETLFSFLSRERFPQLLLDGIVNAAYQECPNVRQKVMRNGGRCQDVAARVPMPCGDQRKDSHLVSSTNSWTLIGKDHLVPKRKLMLLAVASSLTLHDHNQTWRAHFGICMPRDRPQLVA